MWTLVIVWDTGDKDEYLYNSREDAERAGENMRVALGQQVSWYGVRKE